MKTRVIRFGSLSELIEEVELLEKVHDLTMPEFDELCSTLSEDELMQFACWLEKWGMI